MNYYDVQISFMAGDRLVSDQLLGVTGAYTVSGNNGAEPRVLVITTPDGTTSRYNLAKILYWQVHAHETELARRARVSNINYDSDHDMYQTDYSAFIKEEEK